MNDVWSGENHGPSRRMPDRPVVASAAPVEGGGCDEDGDDGEQREPRDPLDGFVAGLRSDDEYRYEQCPDEECHPTSLFTICISS